jgi:hypothetical protein
MVIMGDGLRTLGQPLDYPPYPTITRAPHFYPDGARAFGTAPNIHRLIATLCNLSAIRNPPVW